MTTEYKLIPYNTYKECMVIRYTNALTYNRWSIERALELYKQSNKSYKDYLRCKYTLLLLGPSKTKTVIPEETKEIDQPVEKEQSSRSEYRIDATRKFISLLTNSPSNAAHIPKHNTQKSQADEISKNDELTATIEEQNLEGRNKDRAKYIQGIQKQLSAYDSSSDKQIHSKFEGDEVIDEIKKNETEVKANKKCIEPTLEVDQFDKQDKECKERKGLLESKVEDNVHSIQEIVTEQTTQGFNKNKPESKKEKKVIEDKSMAESNNDQIITKAEKPAPEKLTKEVQEKHKETKKIEHENQHQTQRSTIEESKVGSKETSEVKITNKNGTAIIFESGNSNIHLDSF